MELTFIYSVYILSLHVIGRLDTMDSSPTAVVNTLYTARYGYKLVHLLSTSGIGMIAL